MDVNDFKPILHNVLTQCGAFREVQELSELSQQPKLWGWRLALPSGSVLYIQMTGSSTPRGQAGYEPPEPPTEPPTCEPLDEAPRSIADMETWLRDLIAHNAGPGVAWARGYTDKSSIYSNSQRGVQVHMRDDADSWLRFLWATNPGQEDRLRMNEAEFSLPEKI